MGWSNSLPSCWASSRRTESLVPNRLTISINKKAIRMSGLDLSQFYETFFDEADELLAQMEQLLLGLDAQAPDIEQLNAIFRAAHSIKGGAATFGTFQKLAETTHLL